MGLDLQSVVSHSVQSVPVAMPDTKRQFSYMHVQCVSPFLTTINRRKPVHTAFMWPRRTVSENLLDPLGMVVPPFGSDHIILKIWSL